MGKTAEATVLACYPRNWRPGRRVFEPHQTCASLLAQAQAIAQQQLSAICHAVNVLKISNPAALHNKPMTIKVKVRPAHDGYDASNDIGGYSAINAASAAPTARATASRAASGARATSTGRAACT